MTMDDPTTQLILRVLDRAPQWVSTDLTAKDTGTRSRAEETLAAMIDVSQAMIFVATGFYA